MKAFAIAIALLCGISVARADDKPWAVGVTSDQQTSAMKLYEEGNKAFEQSQYQDALPKYQDAIKIWPHPAIQYNASVCLNSLDRPVEAYEMLLEALRFGEAPLGAEMYRQGVRDKKTLERSVAELEVSLDEPDAVVSVDGKVLFTAPGKASRHLLVSETHQIVAEKKRYETVTQPIKLAPGKPTVLVLKMKLLGKQRKLVRRWPRWVPWAVLAGGVGLGALGGSMWATDVSDQNQYKDNVDYCWAHEAEMYMGTTCPAHGQPFPAALDTRPSSGHHAVSIGTASIGGALFATGFLMIVLNQPHYERAPVVTPSVGPDHAGATLTLRW